MCRAVVIVWYNNSFVGFGLSRDVHNLIGSTHSVIST
jgi:hypothetical protein